MKAEYIQKINPLLQECNDIEMLDLIYQLLQKNQKKEVSQNE